LNNVTHVKVRPARTDARRPPVGFTLIELLVVIAVIALLVTILVPSLRRAKDMTEKVVCTNALRGIVIGFNLYGEDHGQMYPPIFLSHTDNGPRSPILSQASNVWGKPWITWMDLLVGDEGSYDMFICQTSRRDFLAERPEPTFKGWTYSLSTWMGNAWCNEDTRLSDGYIVPAGTWSLERAGSDGGMPLNRTRRWDEVKFPERRLLVADASPHRMYYGQLFMYTLGAFPHMGETNVIMADFSIRSFSVDDAPLINQPDQRYFRGGGYPGNENSLPATAPWR